jgi:tripartite ATP-independent transporter DctM subunit
MIDFAGAAVGFAIMLGFLFLGIHVATALFLVSAIGAVAYLGMPTLMAFGNNTWGVLNDFILTAIPLFILLGEILMRSGVTERMYVALSDWLNRLPGGLLHTNIGASALFAAVSGSSVATAATIGTVALPAFRRRHYNERLVLGSIASGATLGILIPPSINLIIYGAMTNTSIGKLFAAGIIPGVTLAVLFMAIIAAACLFNPSWAGAEEEPASLRERLRRLGDLLPLVFIFGVVMGSIYFGWATPTEAAALGVIASLVLAAYYRHLSFRMLHAAFESTVRITAMIMFIILAAFYLNFIIGILGIPQAMTDFVAKVGATPTQTILLLMVFYLILGCFLETLSMMIATIPVVVPVVVHLGFDPVWFGIFLVLMMEIALFTPPMGMNLYVVQGVRGGGPLRDVVIGALPFLLVMIAFVFAIIAFPEIALWLPGKMLG